MAYITVPTRSTTDTNSSADINQLQDNITYLKEITTPIALSVGGTLATDTDIFQEVNGFTYKWYGADLTITDIRVVQGTPDTGAGQGTLDIKVGGVSTVTSPTFLSGTADVYAQPTLSTNLSIESGDSITLDYSSGTNGDAENLCVFIYCEVT